MPLVRRRQAVPVDVAKGHDVLPPHGCQVGSSPAGAPRTAPSHGVLVARFQTRSGAVVTTTPHGVAEANPDRPDLLMVHDTVRDSDGRIIGCKGFSRLPKTG